MQIMAEIKIRTEEILLQCRYAGVISLSGPTYTEVGIVCPEDSPSERGGGVFQPGHLTPVLGNMQSHDHQVPPHVLAVQLATK